MSRFDIEKFDPPPDPDLVCCICQCVLDGPVESPCRHVFCRICIETWLRRHKNCPTCRRRLRKQNLKPVLPLVQNMLNRLILYCDNKKSGCDQKILLEHYEKHSKECEFELIPCKYDKCDQKIIRKHLAEHEEKTCEFREKLCKKQCRLMILVSKYDSHDCVEELQKFASERDALVKTLKEKVQELSQLTENLKSQITNLQQEFSNGRRHSLFSNSWSTTSSDSDNSTDTTLTDFSINDFSDYNLSDSGDQNSNNQAMTFEEFDQQDRSFWRNLHFDDNGNINTRRRSRRINNSDGSLQPHNDDNEVEIIDVVNTPPQSPHLTSTSTAEVNTSSEVFIDVENNSDEDTNNTNGSPSVTTASRDSHGEPEQDTNSSIVRCFSSADSDDSMKSFYNSDNSSQMTPRGSYSRGRSDSSSSSNSQRNYYSNESSAKSSHSSKSGDSTPQYSPGLSPGFSNSDNQDSSTSRDAVSSYIYQLFNRSDKSPKNSDSSQSEQIQSSTNSTSSDADTEKSTTESMSTTSSTGGSSSFCADTRTTAPLSEDTLSDGSHHSPSHTQQFSLSSEDESEQNEIENDVLIRDFTSNSDSENEISPENIVNLVSKDNPQTPILYNNETNDFHVNEDPGNSLAEHFSSCSQDQTSGDINSVATETSENVSIKERTDDSESDVIPVHVGRRKKKRVKLTHAHLSPNCHTSESGKSNSSQNSTVEKLSEGVGMKMNCDSGIGSCSPSSIETKSGLIDTTKRKRQVIYSSDSSDDSRQVVAKKRCVEGSSQESRDSPKATCTVTRPEQSNSKRCSRARLTRDQSRNVRQYEGQRNRSVIGASIDNLGDSPVSFFEPLLEHYNSDSDDTWVPDELPFYSEDTDSEDVLSESDYEVLVPKSTAQLLDECTSDDSDDSWAPNRFR